MSQRILAISAHPDDVEFTSGGSLGRWTTAEEVNQAVTCLVEPLKSTGKL